MSDEAVKVIVRCRPMNDREFKLNCESVVAMDTSIAQVQLRKPNTNRVAPPKMFTFDGAYYTEDTTKQIYDEICFPLVEGVLQGYNGTVFAYGQTGCGKSYTMMGPDDNVGVIPRAFDHIFDQIAVTEDTKFLVHASYLEIYNEEVRDLLGKDVKKKLELKEHPDKGVYVQSLSMHKVHNKSDLERVMNIGSKNRSVGATLMNVDSSRSHSIFSINLEMMGAGDNQEILKTGKLNLVDLAGSERQSKTGSTGDRLREATRINLSLSALGNVISALVDGKSKHIPYRDSKLTRLLQSSLGGNTKTLMIACVSPADNNYDETLSTLRYANRAKNIKNKPRINEDPKDALLREYQEEIQKLKMMLLGQTAVPGNTIGTGSQNFDAELEAIRKEYEERIAELKGQVSEEHTNRTRLQEELKCLQDAYDREMAEAKERHQASLMQSSTAGGITGLLHSQGTTAPGVSSNDRKILSDHEKAVHSLEMLQKTMIGGERAGDQQLQEEMQMRRKVADERLAELRRLNWGLDNDDDGILEKIFNNLTEEVRAKTRAIERIQGKLLSVEEDVSDLQKEFQFERQDYLDTIRKQEQTILLQQQVLETMVPLIRRDCNYYNLDKVLSDSKFDEASRRWIIPKVTTTSSTSLTPVNSKSGLTTITSGPPQEHSPATHSKRTRKSEARKTVGEDHYAQRLQRVEEHDYFRQNRAQELLAECSMRKDYTPPLSHRQFKALGPLQHNGSTLAHDIAPMPSGDSRFLPVSDALSRPRKLGSLPNPSLSDTLPNVIAPQSLVEKADIMIAQKKKRDNLPDTTRKPYL